MHVSGHELTHIGVKTHRTSAWPGHVSMHPTMRPLTAFTPPMLANHRCCANRLQQRGHGFAAAPFSVLPNCSTCSFLKSPEIWKRLVILLMIRGAMYTLLLIITAIGRRRFVAVS